MCVTGIRQGIFLRVPMSRWLFLLYNVEHPENREWLLADAAEEMVILAAVKRI